MRNPPIITSTNRQQAVAFAPDYADISIPRAPRISGSSVSAVSSGQIANLLQRMTDFFGMTTGVHVQSNADSFDAENPQHAAQRPTPTVSIPGVPTTEDLSTLSADFIREEQRPINQDLKAEFLAVQRRMSQAQDLSEMPHARSLLLQMHGVTQEKVDLGFRRGGAVYSYRNVAGSSIAFLPLILTHIRSQPGNVKNPELQFNMAAAYFVSVIAVSCIGVACNARTLLHCTPIQDAEFDGSPFVARELQSSVTPSYIKIQQEICTAIADGSITEREVTNASEEWEANKSERNTQRFRTAIEAAEKANDLDKGSKHYLARAMLHRVYIEGLQLQSGFQTLKVFGNLAAGWASFVKHDPRMGISIQLGVGLGQMFAQRLVAPSDQVKLQNGLFGLEIASRQLSGIDQQRDDQMVRGMMRTPREVRVQNLQSLVTAHVTACAQQIGDILAMSATDYKKYRALLKRKNDTKEFGEIEKKINDARSKLTQSQLEGGLANSTIHLSLRPDDQVAVPLVEEIRRTTDFDSAELAELIDLSRRTSTTPLCSYELGQLDMLKEHFQHHIESLSEAQQRAFFNSPVLIQALAKYAGPSESGLNSTQLAAIFGFKSRHDSDDEILACVIHDIARAHFETVVPEIHARSGLSQVRTSSSATNNAEPVFVSSTGAASLPTAAQIAELCRCVDLPEEDIARYVDLSRRKASGDHDPAREAELHILRGKLNEMTGNFDIDSSLNKWGIDGLETELVKATRSKNYAEEDRLITIVALKLDVDRITYKEYHTLRMLFLNSSLYRFRDDEQPALTACTNKVNARVGFSPKKVALLADLEKQFTQIENDPRRIIQRRFDVVSDQHKKLVFDGMKVTRDEGLFAIKAETGMLLAEGSRRAGDAAEYMATYAAGVWRAFQLGVAGVNGPLIMTATVALLEQIYKSTLDEPQTFKSPAWPKMLTTVLSALALGANIQAAHRIGEAKAAPLGWSLLIQKLCGGTGSMAETLYQVLKLDTRQALREATTAVGDPKFANIGSVRIARTYFWQTIKTSATISSGLASLIHGGGVAKTTTKHYQDRILQRQTARQILPPLRQTLEQASADIESAHATHPPSGGN